MDDLTVWLDQQMENQRHTGDALQALAAALPAETGQLIREVGAFLAEDASAKRRILDELTALDGDPVNGLAITRMFLQLTLPYADRPGYRDEWKP